MSIAKLVLSIALSVLAIIILGQSKGSQYSQYIETHQGSLPIIISVPHDGELAIKGVPERTNQTNSDYFRIGKDEYTKEMVTKIADELQNLTGKRPYIVASLVHRKFLDLNRPSNEAYEHPMAKDVYDKYYQVLEQTVSEIVKSNSQLLLIDLHGQTKSPADIYININQPQGQDILWQEGGIANTLVDKGYEVLTTNIPDHLKQSSIIDRFSVRKDSNINAFVIEVHKRWRQDLIKRETFVKDFSESLKIFLGKYLI